MSQNVKIDLGGFFKVGMISKGISVKEVSDKSGIAKTSISTLTKNGSCNTETLKRFVEAMGEDLVILFNGIEYHITDKK